MIIIIIIISISSPSRESYETAHPETSDLSSDHLCLIYQHLQWKYTS